MWVLVWGCALAYDPLTLVAIVATGPRLRSSTRSLGAGRRGRGREHSPRGHAGCLGGESCEGCCPQSMTDLLPFHPSILASIHLAILRSSRLSSFRPSLHDAFLAPWIPSKRRSKLVTRNLWPHPPLSTPAGARRGVPPTSPRRPGDRGSATSTPASLRRQLRRR